MSIPARACALLCAVLIGAAASSCNEAPTAPGGADQPPDDSVRLIVNRLDFDGFKEAINTLSQFGDRTQGTVNNELALLSIQARLESYGYVVERHNFIYAGGARQNLYATKVGKLVPGEMYIVSAHFDGRGGGQGADDDASGCALVLELARVLGTADVETARSVRFIFWNNEETGLNGSAAYVTDRAALQGQESPAGSGKYPEPKWLGVFQHDMILFDHGPAGGAEQSATADIDIEFQASSVRWLDASLLAATALDANKTFATDYPAEVSNDMNNTDSRSFQDFAPAVSVRENRRIAEIGTGANPHWHKATDLFTTYSDKDFRFGFNAAQTTLGAISRLAAARIK